MPNENPVWVDACIDSLARQPVNIHHISGTVGDIRQSRYDGFQRGTADYVSYVDLDDLVHPNAFERLYEQLSNASHLSAVYSTSLLIDEHGNEHGLIHPYRRWCSENLMRCSAEVHQLVLARRDIMLAVYDEWWDEIPPLVYTELFVNATMGAIQPLRAVDVVGYSWRRHQTNAHLTNPYSAAEHSRIFNHAQRMWVQADRMVEMFGG